MRANFVLGGIIVTFNRLYQAYSQGGKAMVRKVVTFIGLLVISLGLTAFSGSSRPAAQAGGTSPVVQVLLILGIIILFVLIEWFLLWWLRRRSEAARTGMPRSEVV